jgi:nicotinamidase-related amidase
MKMQRLEPSKSVVAVIDVQERLAAAMPADRMSEVTRKIDVLLAAAEILGVRVIATEQYPKGLGRTISPLAEKLAQTAAAPLEKTAFSAVEVPDFLRRLEEAAPSAVIVVGMEAHVCVYQTVRDLRSRGFEVHVPVDAVVSRHDDDRAAGIALCERTGAVATTVETVVFDWLARAGTDAFRAVSKLLR